MMKRIILALIFLIIAIQIVGAYSKPVKIGEGEYPSIAQDNAGNYWLLFNNDSGLYLMKSKDLTEWSDPSRLPFSVPDDYDGYLRIYDGKFYIVFTRHKIINPHSLLGFDYDVYLAIGDGKKWNLYAINNSNTTIDWYPYIYRDSFGKFWLVYSKDFRDGNGSMIVVRNSDDGIHWSKEYRAIPPNTIFGNMFYFKDRYYMVYAKYIGNYTSPQVMNLHDLYIAWSKDGINWEKAGRLTTTPPPYNFTLYVDAETDGSNIWVAYTSTIEGNEEVYIMYSPDGSNFSKPVRITRNIEYIRSLENPYNFKCDQKDLLMDRDGNIIITYQSAIYRNSTLWISHGKPEFTELVKGVEYNITLSYAKKENSEEQKGERVKTPLGVGVTFLAISIVVLIKRRFR